MPESGQQSKETGESKEQTSNANTAESRELKQNGKPDESRKPAGLVEWAKEHPAIIATGLYVYVSFLGSAYNWLFLRQFDINYFDFAEANDFLTAAFRQPMTFVYLAFAVIQVGVTVKSPVSVLPDRLKRWLTNIIGVRLSAHILFLVILPILVSVYAVDSSSSREVRRTVNGFGSYVVVDLAQQFDTFESLPDTTLMLLGTSDKFIFLWDRVADSNHIVPIANVTRLRLCKGSLKTPCEP